MAGQRFTKPVKAVIITGVVGFLAAGSFIYYNTCILNDYVPKDREEARKAYYEKKYRTYKDIPLPRITDVKVEVDIFPEERRVELRGRYVMKNKTAVSIDTLHMSIPSIVTINSLELPDHELVLADPELGYYIYALREPLAPDSSMTLDFDLTAENHGFVNNGSNIKIVRNGTFITNREYLPFLGYNKFEQLHDRNTRRKYDLPPVERCPKIDDEFARRNTYFPTDADWISFETTVSTCLDQIAVAPGNLLMEWIDGERRYFKYRMDVPMLNFYSFLSADYTVKRDHWNDVDIEVYYHEPHHYNVDRMINAVKKSLDYYTRAFGPYQHQQVRIVEFPRYETYAQSFAGTIPYSESAGFITEVREGDDIDYITYITAHEVAHQWWAHQVIGADVQGATLLSETLDQYSSLMVMEKEYGRENMRKFLKYELDTYLKKRGAELVEEMPLMLVEDQPYIHYNKGSVVMYALRDYLGEDVLNRAIRQYRDVVAYQEPPYTTSREFLQYVRKGGHST